jgi:DNA replication protein DnaC
VAAKASKLAASVTSSGSIKALPPCPSISCFNVYATPRLRRRAATAARASRLLALSFDERLALQVERKVYARGDRKRTRLLQRDQLKYTTATLEDASFEGIRGIDRSALMGLALSTWIERGETICFAGATGLGPSLQLSAHS